MTLHRRLVTMACAAFSTLLSIALWADEVDRHNSKAPLRGTITAESSAGVTIKATQAGKLEEIKVPLQDIVDLRYDGAAGLAIRTAAGIERAGQFERALESYQKAAGAAAGGGFVTQAIQFGQARILAKMALGDAKRIDAAVRGLDEFRTKHPDSRFHYSLHELLGQLYLEMGDVTAARTAFAVLGQAPWPEFKSRAAIWDGRILMKTGNLAEAQAKFDEVAAAKADSPEAKLRRQEALVAKGDCLLKLKKLDEAETMFRQVIDEASPDEADLQATAHNALGDVLREAGKPKEALLAYLQVDLLYSTQRTAHPKALYYLSLLWDQFGRSDSSREAREKLNRLYSESSWAKQASKAGL